MLLIIRFAEVYRDGEGLVCIVTEFCSGGDLGVWIRKNKFASHSGFARWCFFSQTCEAI
eukprot:gene2105-4268_t